MGTDGGHPARIINGTVFGKGILFRKILQRCMKLNTLRFPHNSQDTEILIKDELVPREHGEVLEKLCREDNLPVVRRVIRNCLHIYTDVMLRAEGRLTVIEAIQKFS